MIFIVIPIFIKDETQFEERLQTASKLIYREYAPKFYAIKYNQTSRSLSEILQLGEGPDPDKAIVFSFNQHFGFARADFWKWVEAHE